MTYEEKYREAKLQRDRERHKAYNRAFRESHPDYMKAWKAAHPHYDRERYRAKKESKLKATENDGEVQS